jgi:hypothetical protein
MYQYRRVSRRPPTGFDLPGPGALGEHFYSQADIQSLGIHSRYLCVAKLDDIYQLHRSAYERTAFSRTNPYLLDLIASEVGCDLRNGRCFLLLDLSGEGHPFIREAFEDLHSWCRSVGLNRRSIGLLSQNRSISAMYSKAYPAQADQIHFDSSRLRVGKSCSLFFQNAGSMQVSTFKRRYSSS